MLKHPPHPDRTPRGSVESEGLSVLGPVDRPLGLADLAGSDIDDRFAHAPAVTRQPVLAARP
jgi:hypothetical protein